MKKTPLQKAEEYLQKAKDILNSIPVEDEFDDPLLLRYTDVKSIKKAGRTAWRGCAIALNYALEESIKTYDYYAFEDATREISYGFYIVFDCAYKTLVRYMSGDGTRTKDICDAGIEDAEELIDMCKIIQSIIEKSEEEKRDREERLKKNKSNKKEVRKQSKELLELLLEKTGTKRKDLINLAYQEFVSENLGLLTDEEKRHFDHLVF
jgi:hypothetical protein